jgi:sarcosine oxidase gamma subunit
LTVAKFRPVLLAPRDGGDAFDVVVRLSFADYLLTWLAAMAGEQRLSATVG